MVLRYQLINTKSPTSCPSDFWSQLWSQQVKEEETAKSLKLAQKNILYCIIQTSALLMVKVKQNSGTCEKFAKF